MLVLIEKLLYRGRKFIFEWLLKKWDIHARALPTYNGAIPDINNLGKFEHGEACTFHSYKLRLRVWSGAKLTICAAANIRIGNFSKVGDQVHIYDSDFHKVTRNEEVFQNPVVIGKNVWLGA